MKTIHQKRVEDLSRRIDAADFDLALVTNPVTINYLTGYWGYVELEFGRPTILCVRPSGPPSLISPKLEHEMASEMSGLQEIYSYADGVGDEWRTPLAEVVQKSSGGRVGVEIGHIPAMLVEHLRHAVPSAHIADASGVIDAMRSVKTPQEIEEFRHAGQVAVAMGAAARHAIGVDVPEYEVALAVIEAGTRKSAELMDASTWSPFDSPMTCHLPPIQSGHYTSMPHRRATMRKIGMGEPVFICFCGLASFKHLKPAFDRQYFLGSVSKENERIYNVARQGLEAAIQAMKPGVSAEDVHAAAREPYLSAGIKQPSHRTGRAIGYSVNEQPQLKAGDKAILEAGMVFAVGGDVTIPGQCCGRISDTILVTKDGTECLTNYPRDLDVIS